MILYGHNDAIPVFYKNKERLLQHFGVQINYFLVFVGFRISEIIISILLNVEKSRQFYAILKSLEPAGLVLPWIGQVIKQLKIFNEKTEEIVEQGNQAPLIYLNSGKIPSQDHNDPQKSKSTFAFGNSIISNPKRIAEYLLKGIYQTEIMNSIDSPNTKLTKPKMSISINKSKFAESQEQSFFGQIKSFFGKCFEEPDEYEGYEPPKSLQNSFVMGYPGFGEEGIMIDKKQLQKESAKEKIVMLPLLNESIQDTTNATLINIEDQYIDNANRKGVKFISLAPKIFANIRSNIGVNYEEFLTLFNISQLHESRIKITSTDSQYYMVHSNPKCIFLVKAITITEFNKLKSMLSAYYAHNMMNPDTYLHTILACYALHINEGQDTGRYYFTVQIRFTDLLFKSLCYTNIPPLWIQVNGQTAPTHATNMYGLEKIHCVTNEVFLREFSNTKIDLPLSEAESLISQIFSDTTFLTKQGIIGYSMGILLIETMFEGFVLQNSESKEFPRKKSIGSAEISSELKKSKLLLTAEQRNMGEKTHFVLLEWEKKKSKTDYKLKQVYLINDPLDIEKIKSLFEISTSSNQKSMQIMINFPLISDTYSLKEYVANLHRPTKSTELDNSLSNSNFTLSDHLNQVIKQVDAKYRNSSQEEDENHRRSSAQYAHKESTGSAFGLQELKDFSQVFFSRGAKI